MTVESDDCLFVYGTLRRGVNHPLFQIIDRASADLGAGTIHGELHDLGSYPGVFTYEGCQWLVTGEIFALKADHVAEVLRELDAYEGCAPSDPQPHQYRRQRVPVCLTDGTETEAWVYVLRDFPNGATQVQNGDYLAWKRK